MRELDRKDVSLNELNPRARKVRAQLKAKLAGKRKGVDAGEYDTWAGCYNSSDSVVLENGRRIKIRRAVKVSLHNVERKVKAKIGPCAPIGEARPLMLGAPAKDQASRIQ
jgi:hypothetical protein